MMENLEATKELFTLIRDKGDKLTINEVQQCFKKGVKTRGLQSSEGGLLFNCIVHCCPPEILEYLVSNGVADEKVIVEWIEEERFWSDIESEKLYLHEEYGMYATCKNILIYYYHMYTGSLKITEYLCNLVHIQKKSAYRYDLSTKMKRPIKDVDKHMERLKNYCDILCIPFEIIKDSSLELPDDILEWDATTYWVPYASYK